jgi:hypothetical protein
MMEYWSAEIRHLPFNHYSTKLQYSNTPAGGNRLSFFTLSTQDGHFGGFIQLTVCKFEGVFNNFYLRLILIGGDGDHVKSGLGIGLLGGFQIVEGHHGNLALLFGGNCPFGASVADGSSGLDFHENNRFTVLGNDIDFTHPAAVILFNNFIAVLLQVPDGQVFTPLAEFL